MAETIKLIVEGGGPLTLGILAQNLRAEGFSVTELRGAAPAADPSDCPDCGGEGIVTRAFAKTADGSHDHPCPTCAAKEEPRG